MHRWHRIAALGMVKNAAREAYLARETRIRSALKATGVLALWILISALVSCLGGDKK